ncbi:hypothetical protein MMC25_000097 [Agyrium rufum]|nr:hypothetical protein [Agyrium rufum]
MATSYDSEEKGLPRTTGSLGISFVKSLIRAFSKRQSIDDEYRPDPRHAVSQDPNTTTGVQASPQALPQNLDGRLPAHDKLATFRRVTGITSAREHKVGSRPAVNVGIYARVVRNERQARESFKFSSRLINGCLALQLIVAASLTALGAGNGPHTAVTVFGAVNTVIAGFLTYLKGSGLPNRHKFYASSWSKVREYMEQREREFEREDCQLDVEEVIRKTEEMYEEVRQDVEANEPEAYTSTGQIKRNEGLTPGPQLADKSGEFGHMPHTFGNRMSAMPGPRLSAFGHDVMSQNHGADWRSGFGESKTAGSGMERTSGLEQKMHDLGGDRLYDLPSQRKMEGNVNFDPVREIDQRTQAAIDAGAEQMRSAKQQEAKVEETLKALVTGVGKESIAISNQLKADLTSEAESARLGAAKVAEEHAEKLYEAGEQRLDIAKKMVTRVEDALSTSLHDVAKAAEGRG